MRLGPYGTTGSPPNRGWGWGAVRKRLLPISEADLEGAGLGVDPEPSRGSDTPHPWHRGPLMRGSRKHQANFHLRLF